MEGQIVKNIRGNYTVLSNDEIYICKSRGLLRNQNITPLVGDFVIFDNNIISEVKSRKNHILRPAIANIDTMIIVTSLKEPDFSSNLLDKFLTISSYNNIKTVICFTKLDLCEDVHEYEYIFNYYKGIGYDIYFNTELENIRSVFKNKVVALAGQTGAGKSTLLNKLDLNLDLKTAEISKALGRGKHTTRHVELHRILEGLVADTPGFSSLEFIGMTDNDIKENFVEFHKYSDGCKYRGCMHLKEPGCNIKKMVEEKTILESRYINYKKFIER